MRWPLLVAATALGTGCDDLTGLDEELTPLVQVKVQAVGSTEGEALRVALVWGAPWLPEPFCILPAESPEAQAVIKAGCNDAFGFAPRRVGANASIAVGTPATIDLIDVPSSDVMVGDLTARVAYGSLVVYEDRNGNGTLDLPCQKRHDADEGGGCQRPEGPTDRLRGASFVSMTRPDQRVAFREGGFNPRSAFYPRIGCPAPPQGFSVLEAGGFSRAAAIAAALQGTLPEQDPATCGTDTLDATITVPLDTLPTVGEVACPRGQEANGLTQYAEPPPSAPDSSRPMACVSLPDLGAFGDDPSADASKVMQVVIAGSARDPCKTLTHWVLRGCDANPFCGNPHWDFSMSPPAWWPCPLP